MSRTASSVPDTERWLRRVSVSRLRTAELWFYKVLNVHKPELFKVICLDREHCLGSGHLLRLRASRDTRVGSL